VLTRLDGFPWGDSAMKTIITPADLPQYVPGEIRLDAVECRKKR
jgi:hypothetical protein